ncbi:MAG: response regulator transcription factor [Bacteroidota bacterium]
MATTLLVADDAPAIREIVRDYFEAQGFTVVEAENGAEAVTLAEQLDPDLVLLDVMMPKLDGFGVIRALRESGETPVILLTARVAETDKVMGLELGADDFVTKPFSLHELHARVRAVLRRSGRNQRAVLRMGALVLDRERRLVNVDDASIDLTRSEFAILEALLLSPGRVFSRSALLTVLGRETDGAERTIDVHVRNLRSKVEPDPSDPTFVQTVFGVGYRLAE